MPSWNDTWMLSLTLTILYGPSTQSMSLLHNVVATLLDNVSTPGVVDVVAKKPFNILEFNFNNEPSKVYELEKNVVA